MIIYENPDLILASKSPRRKNLLEKTGLRVNIIPSNINESDFKLAPPKSYVEILSCAKARNISDQNPDNWVLGADTIVVINGTVLGKPKDEDQARRMLQMLSGRKHQVFTGFTLSHQAKAEQFTNVIVTDVYFKHLSADEIDWYLATGEPFDKAGAYAIQGIGTFIVKKINGSYTNVIGLPVCEVMEFLIKKGVTRKNLPLPSVK
jgi:septum formation protein